MVLFIILNHIYCFYGHFGFDDMQYAELAFLLNKGVFLVEDHFSYRFAITGFTAISYSLFGINDFASALPALLLSLGILTIFFSLFKEYKVQYLVNAILFYFLMKWNLFYSDKLMPDIYVSFFVFGAWYFYYRYIKNPNSFKPLVSALLFSLCLFGAFNSKGTVILSFPLWIAYCLFHFNKYKSFWLNIFSVNIIIYLAYFLLTFVLTGNALSRFEAINANSYFNDCSYSLMGWEVMIQRLSIDFINFILDTKVFIYLVISILCSIFFYFKDHLRETVFYMITIVILFLSINFSSISLSAYNPLCLDARHILFITPICSVCCTFMLIHVNKNITSNILTSFLLGALLLGSAYFVYPTYKQARASVKMEYKGVKKELQLLSETFEERTSIYAAPSLCNLLKYYNGFQLSDKIHLTPIKSSGKTLINKTDNNVLLRNWYCDWAMQYNDNNYNQFKSDNSIEFQQLNRSKFRKFQFYTCVND